MNFLENREILEIKRKQLKNELKKTKLADVNEKIKKLEEAIIQINNVLYNYSLFDAWQIGKLISNLMSIYENEKYEFIIKEIYVTYVYADSWGSNEEVVKEEVALLYKKSFNISKIKLEKDLENFDGFVLMQKIYIDEIRFYNGYGKNILDIVSNKYNYIQDFINYLILKKIEKKGKILTFEQMQKYLEEFIILHKMEKKYQKRILNKK